MNPRLFSRQLPSPVGLPFLEMVREEGVEPTLTWLSTKCLCLLGYSRRLVRTEGFEPTLTWF